MGHTGVLVSQVAVLDVNKAVHFHVKIDGLIPSASGHCLRLFGSIDKF